jgi:hypothetical protein
MNKTIYDIFAKNGLPIPNSTKSPDSAKRGVSYYNKDNKENKDNKDNPLAPLPIGRTSSLEATPLTNVEEPHLDGQASQEGSRGQESLDSESGNEQPETPRIGIINPAILPEDVDRCLLTFYDNGEGSRMRYKLGITINPNSAPSERWEFIANLNKDPRIFRRNIPEENHTFVYDFGQEMRENTKRRFRVYPLLGKIHENSKVSGSTNQKEDGCAAAVYWNGSSWMATVMLWEYYIGDCELTDSILTKKQIADNVKAVSGVIYGPNSVSRAEWQKRARPTFKNRRGVV